MIQLGEMSIPAIPEPLSIAENFYTFQCPHIIFKKVQQWTHLVMGGQHQLDAAAIPLSIVANLLASGKVPGESMFMVVVVSLNPYSWSELVLQEPAW